MAELVGDDFDDFSNARFSRFTSFDWTGFGHANFAGAEFKNGASFTGAMFRNGAHFKGITAADRVTFDGATFAANTYLNFGDYDVDLAHFPPPSEDWPDIEPLEENLGSGDDSGERPPLADGPHSGS